MPCVCRSCGVNEAGGRSYRCWRCRKGLSPVAVSEYDLRVLHGGPRVNWTLTPANYPTISLATLAQRGSMLDSLNP